MTGAPLGGTPMAELGEASTPTDPAQRRPVTAICGGSIAATWRHRGRLAACEELPHRPCPQHPDRRSRGRRQDLAGRGGVSRHRGHQPHRPGRGRHHRHRLRARGDPQADLGLPGRRPRRARRLQGQPAGRPRLRRLHRRRALGPARRRRGPVRGLGASRGSRPRPRSSGPWPRSWACPGRSSSTSWTATGRPSPAASTASRPPSARPPAAVPAHRRGAGLPRAGRAAVGPGLHLRRRQADRGRRPRRPDRRRGQPARAAHRGDHPGVRGRGADGPLPRRGGDRPHRPDRRPGAGGGRRAAVPGAGRGGHPQHRRDRAAGGLHPGLPLPGRAARGRGPPRRPGRPAGRLRVQDHRRPLCGPDEPVPGGLGHLPARHAPCSTPPSARTSGSATC